MTLMCRKHDNRPQQVIAGTTLEAGISDRLSFVRSGFKEGTAAVLNVVGREISSVERFAEMGVITIVLAPQRSDEIYHIQKRLRPGKFEVLNYSKLELHCNLEVPIDPPSRLGPDNKHHVKVSGVTGVYSRCKLCRNSPNNSW